MNNTPCAPAPAAASTWWWHPKPAFAAEMTPGLEVCQRKCTSSRR